MTLPPIVCTSWCDDHDGHPEDLFQIEQSCWGPSAYVELVLEPLIPSAQGPYRQALGVMAHRRWVAEVPAVYLHLRDILTHPNGVEHVLDSSVRLTIAEALDLADHLTEVAEMAAGDR